MDGGIITLPLRASVGWTRFLLRIAGGAAGCAVKLGGKAAVAATEAVGRAAGRANDEADWVSPAPPLKAPSPGRESAEPTPPDITGPSRASNGASSSFTEPVTVPRPPATLPESARPSPAVVSEPSPAHVSEEAELVSEIAEPGAEDGAGASISIAEPWSGYRQMSARQVISRLADATTAELAAIELYEASNRNRQTVRAAAQRSLKIKTGRGSSD
jgi:hypothetical protein